MKNLFNLTIIVCAGLFLILGCGNSNKNTAVNSATTNSANQTGVTSNTNASASAQPNETVATAVNKASYDKIKTGMKYDEVVKIFGKEGESLSESEVGKYKTVIYKWDGDSFMSAATLTFQNGKLLAKAQTGLK